MTMQPFVSFIGPSYTLRSTNVDAQRCVNMYPELNELGTGKEHEIAALVGTPGLKTLSTIGTGPVRGMYLSSQGRTFAVSGKEFFEITDPENPVPIELQNLKITPLGIKIPASIMDGGAAPGASSAWVNPSNAGSLIDTASVELTDTLTFSDYLDSTLLSASPTSPTISGVQAKITAYFNVVTAHAYVDLSLYAQLLRSGIPVGDIKTIQITNRDAALEAAATAAAAAALAAENASIATQAAVAAATAFLASIESDSNLARTNPQLFASEIAAALAQFTAATAAAGVAASVASAASAAAAAAEAAVEASFGSPAEYTFGANDDMWGLALTDSDVSASNFGVRMWFESATAFDIIAYVNKQTVVPYQKNLHTYLSTGSGNVGMADNGVDLVLVDGAKGYHFTFATNVFDEITDPDFPAGANVAFFLDQYIIVNQPGTQNFWFSALSDATSWDGLDFGVAEGSPDNLLTILVDHREIWCFGTRSIEVFFDSGDPLDPFQRVQGAFLEEGAIPGSVQAIDNTIFYINISEKGQAIVKRIQGYMPQRISTHAIELALSRSGRASEITSYSYHEKGHTFYVLNVPGGNTTLVYDVATGMWHDRTWTPPNGQPMERHRANCHVFDGTRHLVGDYQNGNIYELDDDTYTDDGQAITRLRRAPHISNTGSRVCHYTFQLDLEAGTGLATGNGSDPKIMLRYSDDGGQSFSSERLMSIGKQGDRNHRAIARRLGQARDRVYEVKSTEPTKHIWIAAFLELEGSSN